MQTLKAQRVVVTGGSRGIGLGIVEALVARGAHVTVVARTPGPLAELEHRLGVGITAGDVTDPTLAERVLRDVKPSVLVLNAGASPGMGPIHEQTWEAFSRVWNTDVQAGLHWIQAAIRLPLPRGSRVIVTSSGAAIAGSPLSGGYAGAKRMLWLMAGYANQASDDLGLGIKFQTLVPRQMIGDTQLGRAGAEAYAARKGVSVETLLAGFGGAAQPSADRRTCCYALDRRGTRSRRRVRRQRRSRPAHPRHLIPPAPAAPSPGRQHMIDLYYWPTPNGKKISIALEELELPYRVIPVNIGRGDQFKPEFLAIGPNNRMPVIVDHAPQDGGAPISVFESGAILIYLADKTGKLLPRELRARTQVHEWLMWQMGGVGPMFGQANHFAVYAPEKLPYAIDRYLNESRRLLKVLDTRLADRAFLAGDYSIADIATFPWVVAARERLIKETSELPHVVRWLDAINARPAVVRGLAVAVDVPNPGMDDEARKHLFGQR